jgi:hypothetical protein
MKASHRTSKKSIYNRVIAADHMKPWCTPGGVSDSTANESGEDGVVLSEDSDPTNDISGRDGCRMAESVGRRNVWP